MILFRCATVAILLVIAGCMLVIGRGHTIYFDNKGGDFGGHTVEAPYRVGVFVDGERVAKLSEGDRGMTSWMGQNFRMKLEITREKDGKTQVANVAMKLPYNMDGIIINIPALLAGEPEEMYLSEFVVAQAETAEDDEEVILTDEFDISQTEE